MGALTDHERSTMHFGIDAILGDRGGRRSSRLLHLHRLHPLHVLHLHLLMLLPLLLLHEVLLLGRHVAARPADGIRITLCILCTRHADNCAALWAVHCAGQCTARNAIRAHSRATNILRCRGRDNAKRDLELTPAVPPTDRCRVPHQTQRRNLHRRQQPPRLFSALPLRASSGSATESFWSAQVASTSWNWSSSLEGCSCCAFSMQFCFCSVQLLLAPRQSQEVWLGRGSVLLGGVCFVRRAFSVEHLWDGLCRVSIRCHLFHAIGEENRSRSICL